MGSQTVFAYAKTLGTPAAPDRAGCKMGWSCLLLPRWHRAQAADANQDRRSKHQGTLRQHSPVAVVQSPKSWAERPSLVGHLVLKLSVRLVSSSLKKGRWYSATLRLRV